MKRLTKYLPLHFLVFLIVGIGIQFYTQIWTFGFLNLLWLLFFLVISLILLWKKKDITFVTFFLFVMIGISAVYVQDARNFKNYYSNFSTQDANVILRISKVLKSGFYHDKYLAEVLQINEHKTSGEILLNIQKDSLHNPLKIGIEIFVKPTFKLVLPSLNPDQFDYKFYLEKQGIHHQLFLETTQFLQLSNSVFSLFAISAVFRDKMQQSLLKFKFKADELAVISALLLGQRQDISKELLTDYAGAGAIHILAVSGLHVGIILLILTFLFKPLEKLKNGKYLKAFCIVLLLWMFAFIAGLSASVVRAVTMFTFLAVGQSFQHKKVVAFSLISSMLLVLIVKPMFLLDVGFQLSYLAVFGIISVQPKLVTMYKPKFLIDKKIWQLSTVSIAAQIGVLPLSIYYFHQFPGLFVVSNLVIIPFLGVILIGGIVIIAMSLLGILPQFLGDIYGLVISLMNAFVSWVSHQEQFLFKDLSISFLMMLGSYYLVFSGVVFLINRSPKRFIYFLISILLLQNLYFFESKTAVEKDAFIVFHQSRFSIIGIREGIQIKLQHNLDTTISKEIIALKSYRIAAHIKNIEKVDFKNYINFKEQDILLIDSLGIYQLDKLKEPIVVLMHSPKINLERLIQKLKPSLIIADGSNYNSAINRWEITALKNAIPFHYTGKRGAFVLNK
jgi:competence protein ComEC